ncbi:hypothetical protein [Candidatus Thiosymbion oneisti]|uniref:hypothetical protein n=1 Tax=Candidatus Thiosymbion oneisti TaxID=589554 RepID=UPI00210DAFEF|nr:hypothetical protein [Candidatus Thiosymbion oneisti]
MQRNHRASAYKFLTTQDLSAVVVIPSGSASLLCQTQGGRLTLKQIQAQVSDRGHDGWRVTAANAAGILMEYHVQLSMKPIFHPPVSPHGVCETGGIGRDGVDKKTLLHSFSVADQAAALDQADAA